MGSAAHGGNGNCVSCIQTLANHKLPTIAGYRIAVDGQYRPATRAAIIRIQQRWGLAADGIVSQYQDVRAWISWPEQWGRQSRTTR